MTTFKQAYTPLYKGGENQQERGGTDEKKDGQHQDRYLFRNLVSEFPQDEGFQGGMQRLNDELEDLER